MFEKKILQFKQSNITFQKICRHLSSAQLSTLLRPFYFLVHPDLFGKHPEQRKTNEESLKLLSAYIESLQKYRTATVPKFIPFYIREKESRDKFKLIQIHLDRSTNLSVFVRHILEVSKLPLKHIASLPNRSTPSPSENKYREDPASEYANDVVYGTEEFEFLWQRSQKKFQEFTLAQWLQENQNLAMERLNGLKDMRDDIERLQKRLLEQLKLNDIQYDCGWNIEHYRGCLKSLERLASTHAQQMSSLAGRVVVFAQKSGVSLDGHVMLFTGDVQYTWLESIRNIPTQDEYRKKVPSYEMALSQVLRNIVVSRRKFMPKAQVVHYASHLQKLTTTMLDYLAMNSFPETWPESLDCFEIVVESESGPLMVSPTGQIIVPAACPGSIVIDFVSNHLQEASQKADEYKVNRYIEKELHRKCTEQLQLETLLKDDSIDPVKMIGCLENLLNSNIRIKGCCLLITHYYSVLSDGTVCIPWNFILK